MRLPQVVFLAGILCLCGCATLRTDQHARELADSRQDDGYCVDHGLHYPDMGYVQCRRQLVDSRLYRDWRNLQLMQRASQSGANAASSSSFRGPDPAGFHCHAEPQFGNDYVLCSYTTADTR